MFEENESVLPMEVVDEDGKVVEVIFVDTISGGADEVEDMPRRIWITRRTIDGTTKRARYSYDHQEDIFEEDKFD